ncbi:MAG TPA: DUF2460 domain-containing protein [Candidatus Methanoperedenaceae archaeon]|nr:DUF2460 domain-containing protein [Candidatus Methanoperedenaceae archaeon]
MIKEVDEALLEILRKGLSELVPSENIIIGEPDNKKGKAVKITCAGFTSEEQGIGGSGGVKKEDAQDKFDADGTQKDFKLSKTPLRPLLGVESPAGTVKREPDDYTVDYDSGTVSFRAPPEKGKGKVLVKYSVGRAVAETRTLKFTFTYALTITADDTSARNSITMEAIRTLYREKAELGKRGIGEITLLKGITGKNEEKSVVTRLEYAVESSIQIEMPVPPMARIEIGSMEK